MRKIVIFMAGVTVLAAPVCVCGTGFGTLISSFKSPGSEPFGIGYRPGYLYISGCGRVVYRTDTTGSIISYYPIRLAGVRGMTIGTIGGETYYWLVDLYEEYVYRYLDNSSTLVGSFPVPGGGMPIGAAFVDPDHMYISDVKEKYLILLHPITGSVYETYPLSFAPNDLAYDPEGCLWITNPIYENYGYVCQCTTEGSLIASFLVDGWGYTRGCGYDGKNLWISTGEWPTGRYTILQFGAREYPEVAPASVGRIKALFQ